MDAPTPPTPPPTLEQLREDRRRLRAERLLAEERIRSQHTKLTARLAENLSLWGDDDFGGSDLWSRLRDRNGERWLPLTVPSDRRHGAEWPLFRTEMELDELRQKSRVLVRTNGYAKGVLRNLINYTVGKGYGYQTQVKRQLLERARPEQAEALQAICDQAQGWVDRFLTQNHWNASVDWLQCLTLAASREQESVKRVIRDGELFYRFFGQDDGSTFVRFIEPEQVRNPPGGRQERGWNFGIKNVTEPFDDVETAELYHVVYADPLVRDRTRGVKQAPLGEYIEADKVLHLKGPDTDGNIKRGVPEFAWDTLDAFQRASKLQRNISMGAAIRAATAELWQFQQASSQQVANLITGLKERDKYDSVTGKTESIELIKPGTIRRIPRDMQKVDPPADQSPSQIQAVQSDLRLGVTGFCAPEYLTGDASNADYSSTKEAGAPFVKQGENWQEYYKAGFARAVWWALAWAVHCGKLPPLALEVLELKVEAPAVLHEDKLEQAQCDQIYVGLGAKSRQTVAAEQGQDWDQTLQDNLEYQELTGGNGSTLQLPGDRPPGTGGPPGGGPGTEPPAPPSPRPPSPRRAAPESVQLVQALGKLLKECGGEGGTPGPCAKHQGQAGGNQHGDEPGQMAPPIPHERLAQRSRELAGRVKEALKSGGPKAIAAGKAAAVQATEATKDLVAKVHRLTGHDAQSLALAALGQAHDWALYTEIARGAPFAGFSVVASLATYGASRALVQAKDYLSRRGQAGEAVEGTADLASAAQALHDYLAKLQGIIGVQRPVPSADELADRLRARLAGDTDTEEAKRTCPECAAREAKDASGHEHGKGGLFVGSGGGGSDPRDVEKHLAARHQAAKKEFTKAQRAHARAQKGLKAAKARHAKAAKAHAAAQKKGDPKAIRKAAEAHAAAKAAHGRASRKEAEFRGRAQQHAENVAAAKGDVDTFKGDQQHAKLAGKGQKGPAPAAGSGPGFLGHLGDLADVARLAGKLGGVNLPG